MPDPNGAAPYPLRIGATDAFARVRSALAKLGFDDANLCRLLELEGMSEIGRVDAARFTSALPPELALSVGVLIRGEARPIAELERVFGAVLEDFLELGLIKRLNRDPQRAFSPVWLYPVSGVLVVSDRADDPDVADYSVPADVVFPAIYGGTLRFLRLLPEARDGEALDLCGGAGIGAFVLSRSARCAVTSDLTPRSAFFAAFSARLNDLPVESLCGDLYAPVAGRQFDLITAHPPFVPAIGPTMVYRDAGETGEDVVRGIVTGLPAHLRPGGRCLVLCVARDTIAEPFEQRVRAWLGPGAAEFDVVFALEKVLTVDEVVESFLKRGQISGAEAVRQTRERLLAANTRQFIYGALWIEHRPGGCRLPPARVQMEPMAAAADFEQLFRVRRARNAPDFVARLADARPRLAPVLEIRARHVVRDGRLVPAEFVFAVEGALPAALRTDGFAVPLIANLTGQHTVREVFDRAATHGELPAGFPLMALLDLVARMIEKGLLIHDRSD